MIQTVSVLCGARAGNSPVHGRQARELACLLAQHGVHVYFGGIAGGGGLLDQFAASMAGAGGKLTAVVSRRFHNPEIAYPPGVEIMPVEEEIDRTKFLIEQSDAIIACPGASSTSSEMHAAKSQNQARAHAGEPMIPLALISTEGFYDDTGNWPIKFGFADARTKEVFVIVQTAEEALQTVMAWDLDNARCLRQKFNFDESRQLPSRELVP